jgi:hypothetical protein
MNICQSSTKPSEANVKNNFTSHIDKKNMIQPTISLEMPVSSQGHYGFHSFPVVD